VNTHSKKGVTPLLSAVKNYNMDMIQLLIDYGADPFYKDSHDKSPMDIAISLHDVRLIDILSHGQ
jgi:ankyrin repeat protein